MTVKDAIIAKCDEIKTMLIAKNKSYGNSALDPIRIFSKEGNYDQLLVRIDDKLSRIARGGNSSEDTVKDLTGYLILLLIAGEGHEIFDKETD